MNRGIRSFKAPSRRDYQKYVRSLEVNVAKLEQALKHLVKSEGTSLVPGRYTVTVPDNPEYLPKPYDVLTVTVSENGAVVLTVEPNAELKQQIEALEAEMKAEQAKRDTPAIVLTDKPVEIVTEV